MDSEKTRTRNPRIDPKAGDVWLLGDGSQLRIDYRGLRRPNQHEYGMGTAKDYVKYRLSAYPGIVFILAVSALKKRTVNAKLVHAAD